MQNTFIKDISALFKALLPDSRAKKVWRRFLLTVVFAALFISAAGTVSFFSGANDRGEEADATQTPAPLSLDVFVPGPAPATTTYPVTSGKKEIVISCDGNQTLIYTEKQTVSEVLAENGIALGSLDETFPSGGSGLLDGMTISVTRVVEETCEFYVDIGYTTRYIDTTTLYKGESLVVQSGLLGSRRLTARQTLRDGFLSENRITNSEVVFEPIEEIVWVGIKEKPAPTTATTTKKTTQKPANPAEPPSANTVTTSGGTVYTYTKKINGDSVAYYSKAANSSTATGNPAVPGKTVAVDPSVIPLGSLVYITAADGKSWSYGPAYAHDVGGGIKGNIVDLFKANYSECVAHGRRDCIIYILKP